MKHLLKSWCLICPPHLPHLHSTATSTTPITFSTSLLQESSPHIVKASKHSAGDPALTPRPSDIAVLEEKKKTEAKQKLITLVLIALGFLALLYPVVSTHFNNAKQIEVAQHYDKILTTVPQETKNAELDRAIKFNETQLDGPILDPWLARITPDNEEYRAYLDQLNITEAMARLRIPSINVDLPILHGTDDYTLEHGIGHLFGSALPTGGVGNHTVLTGHTGLATATLFDNLNRLEEGDSFYIQVMGEMLKYDVDQIKVVRPEETEDLLRVPDKDYVTLVTCTPYGINTHRLLVRGVRVPLDAEEKQIVEESTPSIWQWWMIAILVAVTLMALILLWLFYRAKHKDQRGLIPVDQEKNNDEAH